MPPKIPALIKGNEKIEEEKDKKMKSLAELKRDVNKGDMYFEMIYRFGKAIPERLRGKRKAIKSNSVAIFLLNAEGEESELRYGRAKLIEYDGENLTVYAPAERDLTEEEKRIKKRRKKVY